MKIAFVSTILGYPWGGADTLWTKAAEAAVARGDRVLLAVSELVLPHPRIQALRNSGADVQIRPRPRGTTSLLQRLVRRCLPRPASDPLTGALQRFKPDLLILSCGGTYDGLIERALVEWQQSTSTPTRIVANYQVEHPNETEADRAWLCGWFSQLRDIFFVSTRNLENTRRHLLIPLANASVIQNPLKGETTTSLEWPRVPGEPRFAFVSRLDHGKGVSLALQAMSEALPRHENWSGHVFGRGPGEAHIRATIEALQLGGHIHVHGYVDSLRTIWESRHVLVSPSLEDGVPMTIPEAMLHGRPVLATCVGGAEDWVVEGRSGFLCPAPTFPLLTDTFRRAWAQRANWEELGRRAASAAREHYRPDDYRRLITPP